MPPVASKHHRHAAAGRRPGLRRLVLLAVLGLAAAAGAAGGGWVATRPGLEVLEAQAPARLFLQDAGGAPLLLAQGVTQERSSLEEMPDHLPMAVVAIEDRRFRSHGGVDIRAVLRALGRNLRAGEVVQGGSTITQQLVKITYLDGARSYQRKAHEAMLAREMERRLSKDEILERYLNSVYLGSGAHGVAAAARLYFGRPVAEISLAQSAMLAATIRSPSAVNPLANAPAVQARAALVLDLMQSQGLIDPASANAARLELAAMHVHPPDPGYDGWFGDWVQAQAEPLAERLSGQVVLRTSLDPALQRRAERVLRQALRGTEIEGALVALRPDGTVAAMVGGRDYSESQFNRATEAIRQPGSTFKLFVYLAALAQGVRPEDRITDAPVEIDGYAPENFDGRYRGQVTVAQAFAESLNAATVHLAAGIGIDRVAAAARALGIEAELSETPSLALGASGVSLLDLTEAYAAVATGRMPLAARGLIGLEAPDGALRQLSATAPQPSSEVRELLAARSDLIGMLRQVVTEGTGTAAAGVPGAVGKTGTSQDHRDALFVGWNDRLIVGVWVGHDDNSPMDGVTGGGLPAEIWAAFLSEEVAPQPADLVVEQIEEPDAEPTLEEAVLGLLREQPDVAPAEVLDDLRRDARDGALTMNEIAEALELQSVRGGASCNVEVCQRFYRSFRASDCTFQPYGNRPRELCTR